MDPQQLLLSDMDKMESTGYVTATEKPFLPTTDAEPVRAPRWAESGRFESTEFGPLGQHHFSPGKATPPQIAV